MTFRRFEAHEVKQQSGRGKAPVLVMPGAVTAIVGSVETQFHSRGIDTPEFCSTVHVGPMHFEVWLAPEDVVDRLWGPPTSTEVKARLARVQRQREAEEAGE